MYIRLIYLFLILGSRISYGQTDSTNNSKYWIDITYLNCLEENLPSACRRNEFAPYIYYAIGDTSFLQNQKILNYSETDAIHFDLLDIQKYLKKDSNYISVNITIKNDTLYHYNIDQEFLKKYVSRDSFYDLTSQTCLNRINKSLAENGYNNLTKILKTKNLYCRCDCQYNITTIYEKKKVWAVQLTNDFLYIYKWKYPKTREHRAQKKLLHSFKLNPEQ